MLAPIVFGEATVKLSEACNEAMIGSPFVIVGSRNGIRTGDAALASALAAVLTETVKAFNATDALMRRFNGAFMPCAEASN